MGQKKVVGRNIAITLGIICIILGTALVIMAGDYVSVTANLQSRIDALKAAQLNEVDIHLDFNELLIGSHYVHFYGLVFNSGTATAYNVYINVSFYDSNNVLIKNSTVNLRDRDIAGKSYSSFDTTIDYSGHCANYSQELVHS